MDQQAFRQTIVLLSGEHSLSILRGLRDGGWHLSSEVARSLHIHITTASKFLQLFAGLGLVERRPHDSRTFEYRLRNARLRLELDLEDDAGPLREVVDFYVAYFHSLFERIRFVGTPSIESEMEHRLTTDHQELRKAVFDKMVVGSDGGMDRLRARPWRERCERRVPGRSPRCDRRLPRPGGAVRIEPPPRGVILRRGSRPALRDSTRWSKADCPKAGGSGLVLISSQSPEAVLAELREFGVNLDVVTKENRIRVVDWYSWSEEPVEDVEERGAVVRSSIDLTNLGVALSRAIAGLVGELPRRAVIEILSPATNVYEVTQVYAFAQSAKKKFDRSRFTSLVLLEKDMHSASELTTLHQPFDGVIEIERSRSGDRIVRKIGVLHMKDTAPDASFRILDVTETGMRVARDASKPPVPLPAHGGGVLESQDERARRLHLIMQIASERLKRNPRDPDALFALAAAQATLDDAAGGVQTLDRLAGLDPNYPGLWVLKTKLHARLGQTDLAKESRVRAAKEETETDLPAGPTVTCPMCEAPVAPGATTCGNCGVRFAPARTLEDELDDLGHAAIQEMVQEELATPPKAPAKPGPKPEPRPSETPSTKKGMTNGLALGRGAGRRTGMTNGLKGRTNGLRGRTNGLTNG